MTKRDQLGGFELMVLLAILRAGDQAYGVPVASAIAASTGRDVSMGSLYLTLARLEEHGLVASRVGEPTRERGGRAKTYFRVTARGLKAVRHTQRALVTLWSGVPQLGEGRA
jgi:DNA-binding PadR family transcriptional regulator